MFINTVTDINLQLILHDRSNFLLTIAFKKQKMKIMNSDAPFRNTSS